MGLIRTLQFIATLVVVGPVALAGVFNVISGQYFLAAVFFGLAVCIVVVSEYMYVRVTDGTVGRLRRLRTIRGDNE